MTELQVLHPVGEVVVLPKWWLKHKPSCIELQLLVYFAAEQQTTTSIKALAETLPTSERTVQRAIARLVEHNILQKVPNHNSSGATQANTYVLCYHPAEMTPPDKFDTPRQICHPLTNLTPSPQTSVYNGGCDGGVSPDAVLGLKEKEREKEKEKEKVYQKEKEKRNKEREKEKAQLEDAAKPKPIDPLTLTPNWGEPFKKAWQDWITYRKDRRLPKYTEMGLTRTIRHLVAMANGDEFTACKIIDQSIAQGWQGLFPLKTQQQKKSYYPECREGLTLKVFKIDDTLVEERYGKR